MADGQAATTQRLVVALVRGVHGLRGAVRIEVLTDRPEERFRPGIVLYREETAAPLTIASAEPVADGPGWRVRFTEIATREQADGLRGAYLESTVHPVGDLARGEVYWHEVVGVTVKGVDGADLGVVTDVYRVAENEVYIVSGEPFGTFDVPAVRAFIRIFAPRRGEIVVDVEALDLQPPKRRGPDPDRPRAPRRKTRKPRPVEGSEGSERPEGAEGSPAPEGPGPPGSDEPQGAARPRDPAEPQGAAEPQGSEGST